jgi:hypothetical protein
MVDVGKSSSVLHSLLGDWLLLCFQQSKRLHSMDPIGGNDVEGNKFNLQAAGSIETFAATRAVLWIGVIKVMQSC